MTGRRPSDAPAPPHTDAAHAAITLELVRLSLGGRGDRRLELRVDTMGRIMHVLRPVAQIVADNMKGIQAANRAFARGVAAAQKPPRSRFRRS